MHGEFFMIPNNHIYSKANCPKCSNRDPTRKTNEYFIQKSSAIHNNFYDYSKVNYITAHKKVCIICPRHGDFWQTPVNHYNYGCLKCSSSKGEKKIIEFLNKYNINFVFQKRFKDCRFKRPLPFDFYLPDYNICIEFDGEQHYKIHYQLGKYKIKNPKLFYKNIKRNDRIKTNYCKNRNIKLIRISYKKLKNIDKYLFNKFENWIKL